MHPFTYHRASSLAEALAIAGASADPKYLAGGQTLIPAMKTRLAAPSDLIDLSRIAGLADITVSESRVTLGAAATHAEVARHAGLARLCPAICGLAGHIGDPHVRHLGTIGGSVANNDPAADYPAALLALGAVILTDRREIPAERFFTGLFETALEENEILTAITFAAPARAGYAKFPNPASRYAMAGVFVAEGKDGVRAAVTGAGDDGVFRAAGIEAALTRRFDPAALDGQELSADRLMADIHGTAEYRARLVVVMAKRAVASARP
jgi:carbon-monoxide dehydrogenase medium subunit